MINLTYLWKRIRNLDTLLLILVVIVACMYFVLNVPTASLNVLRTFIDDSIPRLSLFAIPYLLFIPWFWAIILCVWYRNRSFRQLAFATIIVNLIAFFVYVVFQTYIPREVVSSSDIFSGLLNFIYTNDQPYNGFPSLHSALSAVVATYFVLTKSTWARAFVSMAILIVVSTLLVKQHFVLDAISGVTLGVVTTWLIFHFMPVQKPSIDNN